MAAVNRSLWWNEEGGTMNSHNSISDAKPLSPTHKRSLGTFWKERKATSAIELALILPVIAAMIVPLMDLGMAAYTKMEVQNAAQAGADYALKNAQAGFNATNIGNAVTNATGLSGVVANQPAAPSEVCHCVDVDPNGVPSLDAGTAPPCTGTCTSGTMGTYVVVNAQASYTPLFPYPTIPNSITFTSTSTVRVQ
jgi:Flp pilus assembly protein TadG